jgi:hypothetical protein
MRQKSMSRKDPAEKAIRDIRRILRRIDRLRPASIPPPGAGGIKMTNYAYNAMPKTGLYFLEPPDPLIISELLRPKKVKYKSMEFTWLGGPTRPTRSSSCARMRASRPGRT